MDRSVMQGCTGQPTLLFAALPPAKKKKHAASVGALVSCFQPKTLDRYCCESRADNVAVTVLQCSRFVMVPIRVCRDGKVRLRPI